MKISGFTMGKNVSKLYYPIKESIESILPIVDEFVIALGDSDEDDNTLELINSINSDKIRIVNTTWDLEKYPNGMENAHQTDIAKETCTGDWLFYLQADEVVHEKYLDQIVEQCEKYLNVKEVDGFLFNYMHFFGDYNHFNDHHGWYPEEIRIVRNDKEIHSYISAQSFRRIPDFNGLTYRQKEGTSKLNVIKLDSYIYHYGWVRPPEYMQAKARSLETIHKGKETVERIYSERSLKFDYGNMNLYKRFKGTHPKVMSEFVSKFDWANELHFEKDYKPKREEMKHEKFKNRVLTFIEQKILGGKQIFAYSNWNVLK